MSLISLSSSVRISRTPDGDLKSLDVKVKLIVVKSLWGEVEGTDHEQLWYAISPA